MSPNVRTASSAVIGLALLLALAAPGSPQSRDNVRKALLAGAPETAIALALDALRGDPSNAEVRFLLAQAYARAGRWDEAEAILARLLAEHPADADLRVLEGRLLAWRGDTEGAERTFRSALELQPRSADALAGLADLASWRGESDAALDLCRRALDLDPKHAGALFRLGTVLSWQGDYGRARRYLARALTLEPLNKDLARALAAATPIFARRTEVWLAARNEHWSDERGDSSDLGLSAHFGVFDDRARIVVKASRLWRTGESDDRIGLEAYPRLWKGSYGYIDVSAAPGARIAPRSSFYLEVYQSVGGQLEVSLGAGRLSFAGARVSFLAGSAAGYWGRWYPNIRVQWADTGAGAETTWMAGLRRYLAGASYLWVKIGHGERPLETGSPEEVLFRRAWFAEAGFDLDIQQHFKLRSFLSHRRETDGPKSTAVGFVAGYRF
jgi:YaiO family outer membrane protein